MSGADVVAIVGIVGAVSTVALVVVLGIIAVCHGKNFFGAVDKSGKVTAEVREAGDTSTPPISPQ